MNDCELLKSKINDLASHLEVKSYPKTGEMAHICILDIKDNELQKEISKKTGNEFSSLINTTSQVMIDSNENKIRAELPVNFATSKKPTSTQVAYGKLEQSFDCKIDEVHFHGGTAPATHVHFKCDMINKERTLTRVARLIEEANTISNKMFKYTKLISK